VTLEFSEAAQHSQHQPPMRSGCVAPRITKRLERCAYSGSCGAGRREIGGKSEAASSPPDVFERLRRHCRIANGIRDAGVAEEVLQTPRIHAPASQCVAGGMSQQPRRMRRARILDWVRMRRSHDRYNDVEPSSPPQSSPDYTIVIRGYNFREGQGTIVIATAVTALALGISSTGWQLNRRPVVATLSEDAA
jgi:hypothetical protein